MLFRPTLRRKTSKLTATIAATALAIAPMPPVLAQKAKGPPVIRDTEAEQLLRDYTRPILRVAGLDRSNVLLLRCHLHLRKRIGYLLLANQYILLCQVALVLPTLLASFVTG